MVFYLFQITVMFALELLRLQRGLLKQQLPSHFKECSQNTGGVILTKFLVSLTSKQAENFVLVIMVVLMLI